MRLFLTLVLLAAASSARADDFTGKTGVAALVGGNIALGSDYVTSNAKHGIALGASLRRGFSRNWLLGLSYDHTRFDRIHIRHQPVLLNAFFNLAPDSSWNPNLHAGMGFAHVMRVERDASYRWSYTIRLGAGLDKFVAENITVGGTMDLTHSIYDGNTNFGHDISDLLYGVNVAYWFGPAAGDARPARPAKSRRPAEAAKPAEASRRAPADSDRDGVPDGTDQCPDTPKGEAVNAVGCAPDSDNDGVPDSLDKCPATPPGARVNSMGCPKAEKVTIELLIEFDTAKWEVRKKYDPQLQKVADFMKSHPDTKAEIEGHTDNIGKKAYNMDLSQKRADAVRQALIDRFEVGEDRLTAKGYGPTKPVADNGTVEGRAKNRRVLATFSAGQE